MYPNFHNPFADDDEEHATQAARGYKFDDGNGEESTMKVDRCQRQLEQEVMRTAESAMDSSSRSLCLISDSEKIGTEIAEVREFYMTKVLTWELQ